MGKKREWEAEESPSDLIRRLGLPINDFQLIDRALTHRSYANEHSEAMLDNERLEFLGDAVLDFIVGSWLYNQFPEKAEGELTRMRSSLVRTEQLSNFARKLKLNNSIKLGRGEIIAGGRDRDILLCAAFEALVGAIYLGTNIKVVQDFINRFLEENVEEYIVKSEIYDPKSSLQEWSQAKKLGIPEYITAKIGGAEHERIFEVHVQLNGEVLGIGIGHSKHAASINAAMNALMNFENKDL